MPDDPNDETRYVDPSGDDETVNYSAGEGDGEALFSGSGADDELRRLGNYRLISELGRGGQGAVYLAEDERIGRRVALKVLFGGVAQSDQARLRFEREAAVTGKLNHAGIAKIFEFGMAEDVLFIAMELIEGQSLAERIAGARESADESAVTAVHFNADESSKTGSSQGRDSVSTVADDRAPRSAARFVESCARALHVAHEAGLVHRDIKPGNIMVRADESPCILDFGLAHDESADGMTLTVSNDIFGTPAYMAPEQVRGRTRETDRKTDVWALGAALYECCTLKRPFEAPTLDELFDRIKSEEPVAPRLINAKTPKDLEAIILTALDKDPGRRYATAEDLAEDLRRFCEFEPILARPAGRVLKSMRWVQRNKVVAASALVVFVALIAASAVFYFKGEEARRARDEATEALREKDQALTKEQAALDAKTKALVTAEKERNAKQTALDNYDRLADVKRLEAAIAASDSLYPPSPQLVPELEAWQKEHGSLAGKVEGHKKFIAELRGHALPYSDEERKRDFSAERAEIPKAQEALAATKKAITEAGEDEDARKALEERRESIAKRLVELEELTTTGRRNWRFADQALQFQHDVLAELVTDLESFANEETGPLKSVTSRLAQSQAIAKETLEGEIAARWQASRERIKKSDHYSGLNLAPQLGLIPLGPDPESGLEEFLHWLTHEGAIPERDPKTRTFVVTEELGIVLVLIPGGSFLMGSQKDDPSKPNYDPESQSDEQPVNEVTLAPYFLSKYEMTQAQWLRAFQASPSQYWPGTGRGDSRFKAPVDARHPVERVSYEDAQLHLPRIDLLLPTEAEWERAARAGRTDQIFAGCSEIADLRRFANICGSETKAVGFTGQQPGHEDDYILHAPVGSFSANAYGLFDMTGNVWEWCLDGYGSYSETPGPRGLRDDPSASALRVNRGGSFGLDAAGARVLNRGDGPPDGRGNNLGLRPARIIPD